MRADTVNQKEAALGRCGDGGTPTTRSCGGGRRSTAGARHIAREKPRRCSGESCAHQEARGGVEEAGDAEERPESSTARFGRRRGTAMVASTRGVRGQLLWPGGRWKQGGAPGLVVLARGGPRRRRVAFPARGHGRDTSEQREQQLRQILGSQEHGRKRRGRRGIARGSYPELKEHLVGVGGRRRSPESSPECGGRN